MHPILFEIGSVTVHTYYFMVTLAFLTAMGLGSYRATKEGYPFENLVDILLIVIFGGFCGGRMTFGPLLAGLVGLGRSGRPVGGNFTSGIFTTGGRVGN